MKWNEKRNKKHETSVEYTQCSCYKEENVWKKNGVEAIVVMNGVLWLKEKHIKEGLDNKNL